MNITKISLGIQKFNMIIQSHTITNEQRAEVYNIVLELHKELAVINSEKIKFSRELHRMANELSNNLV